MKKFQNQNVKLVKLHNFFVYKNDLLKIIFLENFFVIIYI